MAKPSGGWNHRVMKRTVITPAGHKETVYQIHEVYYKTKKSDTVVGFTTDGIAPCGDSLETLKKELQRMLDACEKPVLNYNSLEKASK